MTLDWLDRTIPHNRRWILAVCLGQVLSLCITATSSASSALWQHHSVSIPFTQNFCNYLLLAIVYGTLGKPAQEDQEISVGGWKFLGYSFADVQANVLAVLAFKSTSVLSALILSSWTLPCIMLLSTAFLGARYNLSHFGGVSLCLAGLGMLIWSDIAGQPGSTDNHSWIGDIVCLLSATLYAISNVTEEYLVVHYPAHEFLSRAGFWGSIICGFQAFYYEHGKWVSIEWTWTIVGLVAVYVLCLFSMYSLAPTLYRLSSATFMTMSLMTSNFYSLVAGLVFLDAKMPPFYPLAYALVLAGVTTYNMSPYISSESAAEEEAIKNSRGSYRTISLAESV
ncbi:solute carrier family 35 member SLC35F1/F2/F6 [Phycomyces nitens]|nr:solute carrier family 35 member SLC35F1/F2/F6 [Phycomyces nitens]